MSKKTAPPMTPLSVKIDQKSFHRADVYINGVNLAANIIRDSMSVRIMPESKRIALTLTFAVDEFEHKGFPIFIDEKGGGVR